MRINANYNNLMQVGAYVSCYCSTVINHWFIPYRKVKASMKTIKSILSYFAAIAVAYLLTSAMGTQFVLADIKSYGLAVSLSDRIAATLHDIFGLLPVLMIIVSATYLVAFVIAALGHRFVGGSRLYWFLAAGFTALPATMMLMKLTMGITPFAPAGTGFGLLLIAFCGLAGAWVYARLTQKKEA